MVLSGKTIRSNFSLPNTRRTDHTLLVVENLHLSANKHKRWETVEDLHGLVDSAQTQKEKDEVKKLELNHKNKKLDSELKLIKSKYVLKEMKKVSKTTAEEQEEKASSREKRNKKLYRRGLGGESESEDEVENNVVIKTPKNKGYKVTQQNVASDSSIVIIHNPTLAELRTPYATSEQLAIEVEEERELKSKLNKRRGNNSKMSKRHLVADALSLCVC